LQIYLTGASQKQDIIEHLMCMARIGTLQEDESGDYDDFSAISYLTDEAKQDILNFPALLTGRRNLLGY